MEIIKKENGVTTITRFERTEDGRIKITTTHVHEEHEKGVSQYKRTA